MGGDRVVTTIILEGGILCSLSELLTIYSNIELPISVDIVDLFGRVVISKRLVREKSEVDN